MDVIDPCALSRLARPCPGYETVGLLLCTFSLQADALQELLGESGILKSWYLQGGEPAQPPTEQILVCMQRDRLIPSDENGDFHGEPFLLQYLYHTGCIRIFPPVFHPKLLILRMRSGEQIRYRVAVGSGNVSGADSLEAFAVLEGDLQTGLRLTADGEAATLDGPFGLLAFLQTLARPNEQGILQTMYQELTTMPVQEPERKGMFFCFGQGIREQCGRMAARGSGTLTVVSPYLDGETLQALRPETVITNTVVPEVKQAAPASEYLWLGKDNPFLHAKLFRWSEADKIYLMAGSANCTRQGLQTAGRGNTELCFVLQDPKDWLNLIQLQQGGTPAPEESVPQESDAEMVKIDLKTVVPDPAAAGRLYEGFRTAWREDLEAGLLTRLAGRRTSVEKQERTGKQKDSRSRSVRRERGLLEEMFYLLVHRDLETIRETLDYCQIHGEELSQGDPTVGELVEELKKQFQAVLDEEG